MNKIKNLLIASLSVLLLMSCCSYQSTKGSGNVITENRTVSDFSKIECSSGLIVYLSQGDTHSVKVVADDNVIESITTKVSNNTLVINHRGNFRNVKSLKIYVTFVSLDKLNVSSGSMVSAEENLDMGNLNINVSSGAIVKMKGEVKNLVVKSASGSILSCEKFKAKNCTLNAGSGSVCDVYASGNLIINASSGSVVNYYGKPEHKDVSASVASIVNGKAN